MKGTVKFFDKCKGWGFITSEEGWEAFVHYSNIVNMEGRKTLDENDIVEFEYGENSFGRNSAYRSRCRATYGVSFCSWWCNWCIANLL